MGKLLLLFTIVPLVELYLLLQLADIMGLGSTILLVLVTGILGASLAKAEGLRVLRSWQNSLAKGEVPEEGVIGGLLVLIGGVLLVTPGVLTDFTGLLLLLPTTRKLLIRVVRATVQRGIESGHIHVSQGGFPGGFPGGGFPGGGFPGAGGPPPGAGPQQRPRPRMIDREVIEVEAKVIERDD